MIYATDAISDTHTYILTPLMPAYIYLFKMSNINHVKRMTARLKLYDNPMHTRVREDKINLNTDINNIWIIKSSSRMQTKCTE